MKIWKPVTTLVASTLAAAVFAPGLASACAMCGLAPGDHAIHAYNASVLFMLAGPYVTMAAIGGVIFVAYYRSTRGASGQDGSGRSSDDRRGA